MRPRERCGASNRRRTPCAARAGVGARGGGGGTAADDRCRCGPRRLQQRRSNARVARARFGPAAARPPPAWLLVPAESARPVAEGAADLHEPGAQPVPVLARRQGPRDDLDDRAHARAAVRGRPHARVRERVPDRPRDPSGRAGSSRTCSPGPGAPCTDTRAAPRRCRGRAPANLRCRHTLVSPAPSHLDRLRPPGSECATGPVGRSGLESPLSCHTAILRKAYKRHTEQSMTPSR